MPEPEDRPRAQDKAAGAGSPATPRPASTVVLARDCAAGIEIYLVQRHGSMGFMGGMHVFPGGKVAPGDAVAAMHARVADAESSPRHAEWGPDVSVEAARARAVAGVRETFEEAGVLLAPVPAGTDLGVLRRRLLAGEDFAALLEEASCFLYLAWLEPLARWITPEREPVRFDTSFYVARAPDEQRAEHDQKESIAGVWLTPNAALDASTAGSIRLAPPTARTLEGFVGAGSVEVAMALARRRPPPLIQPVIRSGPEGAEILYPGDPEHPDKDPVFAGPTRRLLRK